MRIDRRRPSHGLALALFFVQSLLALALRVFRRGDEKKAIVLYGHKLNGNLLALYLHLQDNPALGLNPVFLTMDANYHRELRDAGVNSHCAVSLGCSKLLAGAAAIVTSHGLHALQPLRGIYQALGLRFFDVWHGIPFKGFDADDFRVQHKYDEVWVASSLNRELYIRKFGFAPERVVATGYARTDRLVHPDPDMPELRAALGLPSAGKLVLFAPTWAQDTSGRSLFPLAAASASSLVRSRRLLPGTAEGSCCAHTSTAMGST